MPDPAPIPSHSVVLREFLSDRDAPCPACGYNLRGLTGDRCPECSELLELRVGLVHAKLASFIATLVALAAGAGFSGLLLLYFFFVILTRGRNMRQEWAFLLSTGGGLVVEGGLLLLLIAWRPRLGRRGPGVRWSIAGACWLLSAANLFLFAVSVR